MIKTIRIKKIFVLYTPFLFSCGHAALYEALSVHWSVGPLDRCSIGPSVMIESKSGKDKRFRKFLFVFVRGVEHGIGVWMGIGRPCSPVRNDTVTPRHLF